MFVLEPLCLERPTRPGGFYFLFGQLELLQARLIHLAVRLFFFRAAAQHLSRPCDPSTRAMAPFQTPAKCRTGIYQLDWQCAFTEKKECLVNLDAAFDLTIRMCLLSNALVAPEMCVGASCVPQLVLQALVVGLRVPEAGALCRFAGVIDDDSSGRISSHCHSIHRVRMASVSHGLLAYRAWALSMDRAHVNQYRGYACGFALVALSRTRVFVREVSRGREQDCETGLAEISSRL